MPHQSSDKKSIPDQKLTEYLTAFHEIDQRENPPKSATPAPEKRVSIKDLFAENKLFLAVGGLVPLVFFGSMVATQMIATSTIGQREQSSSPAPQNQRSQITPTAQTVKMASIAATTLPSTFPPAAQAPAPTPFTQKSETVISQKSTPSTNPYKRLTQPRKPAPVTAKPIAPPPAVAPPPPNAPTGQSDGLKQLTADVVNTLQKLKQQENNPTSAVPNTDNLRKAITALVSAATSKGKSTSYVQSLIDDALAGRNAIPTALANADGKLDTQLLLSSVLPKNNAEKVGNTKTSYLSALESESAALTQKRKRKSARVSTTPYIILKLPANFTQTPKQVYGDPLAYVKIYRANQALLSNANILTIGMRLKIPR